MYRIYLIYFILQFPLYLGNATELDSLSHVRQTKYKKVRVDTSKVTLRAFDAEKITAYKKDPAFDYKEERIPIGWWERFKQWLFQQFSSLFSDSRSTNAMKWMLIVIGSAALLFFIYKLSGMDILQVFGRRNRTSAVPSSLEEENIHEIDFEAALQAAVEKKNYRQAIRLLYLQLLKELTDRRLIDWQPGKTNRTYIQELREKPYIHDFNALTSLFEQAWYGAFPVGENDFSDFRNSFLTLKNQV